MITALAVVLVSLYLLVYAVDKARRTSKLSHLPGPAYPLPIFGHVVHMLGPREGYMRRGMALWTLYGPGPVKFWLGEVPTVTLTRPEDVEPVLSSQSEVDKHDMLYSATLGFFGNGLLTLNGKAWLAHRRALTPAFHFRILDRYAGVFTRRAAAFAAQLGTEVPAGQSFNIMSKMGAFVIGSLMETAFGINPDLSDTPRSEQSEQLHQLVRAADETYDMIAYRILHPWLLAERLFKLSALGRRSRQHEATIAKFVQHVIEVKRAQLQHRAAAVARGEQVNGDDRDDDDDSVREKFTFLDMALSSKNNVMSDSEIIQEVRTLIAVQQTTASTISFIMVMLALHPEVQERARAEVREVNAIGGLSMLERLKRLKYVERVIKETLRLFPVTTFFARKLKKEMLLPDQKTLPAGVTVIVFMYLVHRDPRHWPLPEEFDPDRFLPERCSGRHPYSYAPFSAGPRNCIGQRYAMLQMTAVVAAILARLRVRPGEGCETRAALRVNADLFLKIEGGFNVRLEPVT
ncbi:Cytochrome P450 4C1 [Frankliniella fusca]|uniref:Cytochrome P450 4C1 n=1 Tax=Frankliniella fusca TaxID=407009 RepID=A0AAE1LH07_9NEOP|nr:Cytochrome P450 4C1 [Frankliniella fusca]